MYLERKIVTSLEKTVFSGEMDHGQIVEECRRVLKRFGVRVELSYSDKLNGYEFEVSGHYDSSRMRQPINLVVYFSLEHGARFRWTGTRVNEFRFKVSQVLQHELIHKCQAQYRLEGELGYPACFDKNKQEQLYLANKDEIGAYAHDIMMELKQQKGRWTILRQIGRYNVPSYNIYKQAFGSKDWHKVKHRLLKQVFKWMEN